MDFIDITAFDKSRNKGELSMQPVELYPGVVSDPNILGGKPVLKGMRVPVSLVLGKLAGGMSVEEVIYEYYLDMAAIRAALGYAAQQLAEEVIYATKK